MNKHEFDVSELDVLEEINNQEQSNNLNLEEYYVSEAHMNESQYKSCNKAVRNALIVCVVVTAMLLGSGLYLVLTDTVPFLSQRGHTNEYTLAFQPEDHIDVGAKADVLLDGEIPAGMETISGDHISGMLRTDSGEFVIYQIFNGVTEYSIDGGVTWTQEKPQGAPDIPR